MSVHAPLQAHQAAWPASPRQAAGAIGGVVPGLLLCTGVAGLAMALAWAEALLTGRAWLDTLVLAILVGTVIRTAWAPGRRWTAGIGFGAKALLEAAVVLLGLSVGVRTVLAAGPGLLLGIAGVVVLAIGASYAIGRLLRLPHRLAVLVACGNSICGNSAIATVAPVIGADGQDVAASIAFTAVLGVAVVLALPLLVPLLHLGVLQYGALAGLTVYAVPQVLAATAPVGAAAVQLGTLVKLVRVLMLGPVVLTLSLLARRACRQPGAAAGRVALRGLVPWFILGFLALAGLRSAGLVPVAVLAPASAVANLLTVISMAALGLGTDLRMVARAGGRVSAAAMLSLLVLGAIGLALIFLVGLPS